MEKDKKNKRERLKNNRVRLPVFNEPKLEIPPFFIKKTKKGWKLVNPLTSTRTLSTRQKDKSIKINKSNMGDIELITDFKKTPLTDFPKLKEFSKADQKRILEYGKDYAKWINRDIYEQYIPAQNKPRGFPFKNYRPDLYSTMGEEGKVEGENPMPKKPRGRPPIKAPLKTSVPPRLGKNIQEKIASLQSEYKKSSTPTPTTPVEDLKGDAQGEEMSRILEELPEKPLYNKIVRLYKDNKETYSAEIKSKIQKSISKAYNKIQERKGEGKGKGLNITLSGDGVPLEDILDDLEATSGKGLKGGKLSPTELKDLLQAGYDPKKHNVGDFVLDKSVSSGTSKVYYDKETGRAVVVHRGTQGILDWANNLAYAVGGDTAYKQTKRFKEAQEVQRKAEEKYGASNVSTIGHSQGGKQAELLGGKSKEIITLNKATRAGSNTKQKNQTDIRTTGDWVSSLNPFQKKSKKDITIKSGFFSNPLTEHSTDTLSRLEEKEPLLGIGEGLKKKSHINNIMPRRKLTRVITSDTEDSGSSSDEAEMIGGILPGDYDLSKGRRRPMADDRYFQHTRLGDPRDWKPHPAMVSGHNYTTLPHPAYAHDPLHPSTDLIGNGIHHHHHYIIHAEHPRLHELKHMRGGNIPAPPSRGIITDPHLLGLSDNRPMEGLGFKGGQDDPTHLKHMKGTGISSLKDLDMNRDKKGKVIPDEIRGIPINAFADFLVRGLRKSEDIDEDLREALNIMPLSRARRLIITNVIPDYTEEELEDLVEKYHRPSNISLIPHIKKQMPDRVLSRIQSFIDGDETAEEAYDRNRLEKQREQREQELMRREDPRRGTGVSKGPRRFVKGSKEAKEFMANLRAKKMKGGKIPAPHSRLPVVNPDSLV